MDARGPFERRPIMFTKLAGAILTFVVANLVLTTVAAADVQYRGGPKSISTVTVANSSQQRPAGRGF